MSSDRKKWLLEQEEIARILRDHDTSRGTRYVRIWTSCFAIYFVVFMIPDLIWINIGIGFPEQRDIPSFVWTIIRKTSFPVSAYVFWVVTPFFVVLCFCILVVWFWPSMASPNNSKEFQLFLKIRESRPKNRGKSIIFGCFVLFLAFYTMVLDPTPETNPIFISLKPFQNKLSFFLLYGGGAFLLPALILLPVGELRYFIFRLTHRR
jgi:hypothetical protein